MDPDDELDDAESSHALLPADDRLWRHPSEMSLVPRVRRADHRMWTVAVFAGLVGALLATGATVAAGGMRTRTIAIPAVEHDLDAPVMTLASQSTNLAAASAAVRPSCVTLMNRNGTPVAEGVVFRSDGMALSTIPDDGTTSLSAMVGGTRRVTARVVATDPASDLAVVKLDGIGFTPAPLGSALDVRVGDPVYAMRPSASGTDDPGILGSLVAFDQSVTTPLANLAGLLQISTTAPPEAMGAPIVDSQGAVIGIATATGQSAEFATPVDWARQVATQLLATGRVVPAWLGVAGHDLTAAGAAAAEIPGGAVVDTVYDQSPAASAGIKVGDLIVAINGRVVTTMGALVMAVHAWPVGSPIVLDVRRGTAEQTITAVLQPKPADID